MIPEVNPLHAACRSYLLRSLSEEGSSDNKPSEEKLRGYAAVLAIGSSRCKSNTLGEGQGRGWGSRCLLPVGESFHSAANTQFQSDLHLSVQTSELCCQQHTAKSLLFSTLPAETVGQTLKGSVSCGFLWISEMLL